MLRKRQPELSIKDSDLPLLVRDYDTKYSFIKEWCLNGISRKCTTNVNLINSDYIYYNITSSQATEITHLKYNGYKGV